MAKSKTRLGSFEQVEGELDKLEGLLNSLSSSGGKDIFGRIWESLDRLLFSFPIAVTLRSQTEMEWLEAKAIMLADVAGIRFSEVSDSHAGRLLSEKLSEFSAIVGRQPELVR